MLIGFHGRAGAGKDTAYKRLKAIYGSDVERISFADLLYTSAAAALGVRVRDLQDWKSDPAVSIRIYQDCRHLKIAGHDRMKVIANLSVREYLQNYGTEAHRNLFGSDFWVDHVEFDHVGRIVCVTDVRFDNEALAVRRAGGQIVRLVGSEEVEGKFDSHSSEVGIDPSLIDFTLPNSFRDDAFESLDSELQRLVNSLGLVTGA